MPGYGLIFLVAVTLVTQLTVTTDQFHVFLNMLLGIVKVLILLGTMCAKVDNQH